MAGSLFILRGRQNAQQQSTAFQLFDIAVVMHQQRRIVPRVDIRDLIAIRVEHADKEADEPIGRRVVDDNPIQPCHQRR